MKAVLIVFYIIDLLPGAFLSGLGPACDIGNSVVFAKGAYGHGIKRSGNSQRFPISSGAISYGFIDLLSSNQLFHYLNAASLVLDFQLALWDNPVQVLAFDEAGALPIG